MKTFSKPTLLCVICFISAAFAARGQSVPAETGSPVYTGFSVPTIGGTLHYALSAGGREVFGYTKQQGTITDGTFSGNVGLLTASVRMPTTLTYTGGYIVTTNSQIPSAFFHDFSIAQAYNTRKWRVDVSDNLRYLPDTPASGIYGVVGAGTSTGVTTSQGALIPFATRIDNTAMGTLTVQLTGKTSIDGTGLYSLQRFPGYSGGIQTNNWAIAGGPNHRIDALQSAGASYRYDNFSYININGSFDSQGGTLLYKRQWTRKLNVSLAGGPQYISASSITNRPSQLSYNADIMTTYVGSLEHGLTMSGSYKRATSGGSGLTYGSINDTFTGTTSGRLTRSLTMTALGTYSRSTGLTLITNTQVNTQTAVGSVQANRAFTRTLSAFVSYTALHQSVQGLYSGPTPLIGLQQVLGFGVTYSPSPVHLGR